ncbi:MAG: hypothetical protein IJ243_00005 [Prevotella sp.]|nr:hypothetical protein [Prevotella sp.]
MKRSLPLYLLLLVLSLCCACTDHHAMVQRLAYVSACNRADTVFTSRWLPTVDSLVSYFDRYGRTRIFPWQPTQTRMTA